MKIAFINRSRSSHPGGDLVAIDETMAALRCRGIECEYAPEGWTSEWLSDFDVAHLFHMNFGWSLENIKKVYGYIPYVLTPIYYPDFAAGVSKGEMLGMLLRASMVMPFSNQERTEITAGIPYAKQARFYFVPNGTSQAFHHANVTNSGERKGVIAVAAREGDKGLNLVAEACDMAGLPFHKVTGIPYAEMPLHYATARVFVNASGSERMSLTTGEALCAGCRVIDTEGNRGREWYGDRLVTWRPSDGPATLAALLTGVYTATDWDYAPNNLARSLTWDMVAAKLIVLYGDANPAKLAFTGV